MLRGLPFFELNNVGKTTRSTYQCSSVAPRLLGLNCKFATFSCLSIPEGHFETKKTPPNVEVCPESLEAMLDH